MKYLNDEAYGYVSGNLNTWDISWW